MPNRQLSLLHDDIPHTYASPRLKLLPLREQPAFRVARELGRVQPGRVVGSDHRRHDPDRSRRMAALEIWHHPQYCPGIHRRDCPGAGSEQPDRPAAESLPLAGEEAPPAGRRPPGDPLPGRRRPGTNAPPGPPGPGVFDGDDARHPQPNAGRGRGLPR